jgi:hypothetical protein
VPSIGGVCSILCPHINGHMLHSLCAVCCRWRECTSCMYYICDSLHLLALYGLVHGLLCALPTLLLICTSLAPCCLVHALCHQHQYQFTGDNLFVNH